MAPDLTEINESVLKGLVEDVALIKHFLIGSSGSDPEGELSDWAKKELSEARKIPNSENISLEEMEQRILVK